MVGSKMPVVDGSLILVLVMIGDDDGGGVDISVRDDVMACLSACSETIAKL